ncbi:MAG: DUF3488 and transglutaminase-like domain-containing protein [Myxococcales bacterium]|nr:DUF3488 and transglutaminase-like domain-containing protein [Myxococcales bacterium]
MRGLDARTVGTVAAIGAGLTALGLLDSPLPWVAAVAVVATALAWGLSEHLRGLPWAVLTAGVVGGLVGAAWWGVEPPVLLGALLAYLQVHRAAVAARARDQRVSLLLSALMLVVAAGGGVGPVFGLLALVWAVALPVALLPPGAVGFGTVVRVAVVGVAAGAVLFVLGPRPAGSTLGGPSDDQVIGFATEVQLGDLDSLLVDPAVVFRARLDASALAQGPLHWRGIALDAFDGRAWTSTLPPASAQLQPPARFRVDAVRIEVIREAMAEGILFTTGRPVHVDVGDAPAGSLAADWQGGWFLQDPGRVRYELVVLPPFGTGGAWFADEGGSVAVQRALQLPADLDPRIGALARTQAGAGTPRERLERLAEHLRTRYAYTRRPADAGTEEPLDAFLFERRSGHCEYFAASLAVMLRTQSIPARVVNGFVGGEHDPATGWVTVRRYHAHSWVEAHLPGEGWVVVDATPGPGAPVAAPSMWARAREALDIWWVDQLLAYDRTDQVEAMVGAGETVEALWGRSTQVMDGVPWRGWLLLAGSWLVLGLGLWGILRAIARRRGGAGAPVRVVKGVVARQHARARTHLAGQGIRVPAALPPVAAAQWVQATHPGAHADALLQLAWLYYDVALGGASDAERAARARQLVGTVRQLQVRDVS